MGFFKKITRFMNPRRAFRASNNPLHKKGPIARGFRQVSGKTAAQKAAREGAELDAREKRESAAFTAEQKKIKDRLTREESDAVRGKKRSSSRRSLLTGDERGVSSSGQRKTTG